MEAVSSSGGCITPVQVGVSGVPSLSNRTNGQSWSQRNPHHSLLYCIACIAPSLQSASHDTWCEICYACLGRMSIVVNPVEMYSSLTGSIRPYTLERGTARLDYYSPPAPFLLIP